jgi:hypothetical protein
MSVKREVLTLVGLVLLVDAIFIGGYFLAGLRESSPTMKVAYTVIWTLLTLVVVIRGLARVRNARLNRGRW